MYTYRVYVNIVRFGGYKKDSSIQKDSPLVHMYMCYNIK